MSEKKFPEHPELGKAKDDACSMAIQAVFRGFDESKVDKVRAWANESLSPELRSTLATVMAFCFRQTLDHFYQVGFACGVAATASLTKQGGLGERTVVAKYDSLGRIAEMVKIPLTAEERIALDAQKSAAGD